MTVTFEGVVYEIHRDKYNKFNSYAVAIAPADKNAINITINNRVDGIKVVKINNCAFSNMNKLEAVFTADLDVLTIGMSAFAFCKKLKTFHSCAADVTIDKNAFQGCTNLINIWCRGIVKLRPHCFVNCPALIDVGTLMIVEEESFINCTALKKLSFCDKVSVRGNIFKNTIIDEVFCYGDVLFHNNARMSMFANKSIHCKETSNMAELAYEGSNVIFW